jgi:hypothetical protein
MEGLNFQIQERNLQKQMLEIQDKRFAEDTKNRVLTEQ